MNKEDRASLLASGLSELNREELKEITGRNGEALAHDEAAVWKRVLNFRLAQHLKPKSILETHPGLGISTSLYAAASPGSAIFKNANEADQFDLIDIDPFGQPWDTIAANLLYIRSCKCVLISNGEAFAVRRNLTRAQRYPTSYYGKQMPRWVTDELKPRLEEITGKPCQFFYAYPTTIRLILSSQHIPSAIWDGCPNWMWWLAKYAK